MDNNKDKSVKTVHKKYPKHIRNTERYFCENCVPYDDDLNEYDDYCDDDDWLKSI